MSNDKTFYRLNGTIPGWDGSTALTRPYNKLSSLRNVISGERGQWVGRFRREFEATQVGEYVKNEGDHWPRFVRFDEPRKFNEVHQIQRLEAVLKQNNNGSLTLELDWVDYNGE